MHHYDYIVTLSISDFSSKVPLNNSDTISDLNRAVLIFKHIIFKLKDGCMVVNASRKRYKGFRLYRYM